MSIITHHFTNSVAECLYIGLSLHLKGIEECNWILDEAYVSAFFVMVVYMYAPKLNCVSYSYAFFTIPSFNPDLSLVASQLRLYYLYRHFFLYGWCYCELVISNFENKGFLEP